MADSSLSLQQVAPDGARYQTSLWEIDPAGVAEPRRLTHSEPGRSEPAFAGDGSLLFTSKRPGPDGEKPEEPALWRLPRQGEAARIATSPGWPVATGQGPTYLYVVTTSRLPGTDEEGDRQWRKDRKESKVSAILHDGFPVRTGITKSARTFRGCLRAGSTTPAPCGI